MWLADRCFLGFDVCGLYWFVDFVRVVIFDCIAVEIYVLGSLSAVLGSLGYLLFCVDFGVCVVLFDCSEFLLT